MGKTRQPYAASGVEFFLERIKPFAQVEVVEVKDARGSSPQEAVLLESERILRQAQTGSYTLLDERGRKMDSIGFAQTLRDKARMDFVLGGAYGVSDEVRKSAADSIALSPMTFSHELARVVFLEQLYRAFSIITGRGYHH